MPMEPDHYDPNAEKNLLHREMSDEEISVYFSNAEASVPYAVGLNNHMGSGATQDIPLMTSVARQCAVRNWWILDSITHPRTVLYSTAVKEGVPAFKRDVFLDHEDNPEAVLKALMKAVNISRKYGRPSIAIGHPRKTTWEVLKEEIPALREKGVEWISLSSAVKGKEQTVARRNR